MRREVWLLPPVAVALLVVGYLVDPHLVYDQFVWRYYWGPIVADAAGGPVTVGGVTAQPGYNWVNTLTWAAVLGAAVLGLIRVLRRMEVTLERSFLWAMLPMILFGATTRALEDAGIFGPPLEYLLITPLIYFVIFAIAFASLVVGELLERRGSLTRNQFVAVTGGLLLAINLLIVLGRIDGPGAQPWVPVAAGAAGLLLAGAAVAIGRSLELPYLSSGTALAVVFAHMFDATSTFLGYGLGYSEKHVLPTLLIDLTGTSAVMYPLKLLVVVPVLYLLYDWEQEEEADRTFVTLLYLTVIVLGLGPGTRNVTRMAMGV